MEVIKTWIVNTENGLRFIFQTFEGNFYISSMMLGEVIIISEDQVQELIRKTE